jgi:replicative DNA helicase
MEIITPQIYQSPITSSIEEYGQILEQGYHDDLVKAHTTKRHKTGWPVWDEEIIYGFAGGQFTIIAGDTAMGKTQLKTNLLLALLKNGASILSVCPEMGRIGELDRLTSIMTNIPLKEYADRDIWLDDDIRFYQLMSAVKSLASNQISFLSSPNTRISDIERALKREHKDIVFIDLFDRLIDVNVTKERTGVIFTKLSEISALAKTYDTHPVLLVQVNRDPSKRTKDHRPTSHDLRECGGYEQMADNVLLIYRPSYYDSSLQDWMEMKIAKQRGWKSGKTIIFDSVNPDTMEIRPSHIETKVTLDEVSHND